MANWFIALPVASGPWFHALEPPPELRKFGPHDLHLTVAFLGPVGADAARRAFELARDFPLSPLRVRLGALAALGGRRRPSAFSALLSEGREQVERAMGLARDAMFVTARARPETRPPLAHVTLARPQRRATDAALRAAVRWAASVDLGAPTLELDRVALYTWSTDRAAALFRIDRSLPLQGTT